MFKATLDGNGLVIYSDQPEGELLSNMAENDGSEIKSSSLLSLEPSVVLKGAFAVKNNWDRMSSFDKPYQMSDFAPFDMVRFGLLGDQIYSYLLDRHKNLMLQSVDVEYKELPGSSLPVALTMWIFKGSEWSSELDPFFFREHTGKSDWQIAHLSLDDAFLDGASRPCPFKTLQDAPRNEGGFVYSEYAYELHGCFKHVELWTYRDGNFLFSSPIFILSGGVGAIRRMSFNFASSQFWGGFQNAAELIHLYERPEPPTPVDPVDPVDPADPFVVEFFAESWKWYNEALGMYQGYPTAWPVDEGVLTINGDGTPWINPCAISSVAGGPGGVAIFGEDANMAVKWHIGSNGGLFKFYQDGKYQFHAADMFHHLGLGETLSTFVDFAVQDDISEYVGRALVTITGVEPETPADEYTLRPLYIKANNTDVNIFTQGAAIFGNVFSNSEDPTGWLVTSVKYSSNNVDSAVSMQNFSSNSCYPPTIKISENGDFEFAVSASMLSLSESEHPAGYTFVPEVVFSAQKNGQSKSTTVYAVITVLPVPYFVNGKPTPEIVKVDKDGSASGKFVFEDFVNAEHIYVSSAPSFCKYDENFESCALNSKQYIGTGSYAAVYYNFNTGEENYGGLVSIDREGNWTFDTNSDFSFIQDGEAIGIGIVVTLENEKGVTSRDTFAVNIQVGDTSVDIFGDDGP